MNHIYKDQPVCTHIQNLLSKTGSKLYVPINVETWQPLACHYFPQQKWGGKKSKKAKAYLIMVSTSYWLIIENFTLFLVDCVWTIELSQDIDLMYISINLVLNALGCPGINCYYSETKHLCIFGLFATAKAQGPFLGHY